MKQLPSKLGRRLASSPRARRLLYELRNRRVFADLYQHDRMLADSVLEGFCVYFEARFDDEIAFISSPADTPTSWGTPFLRASPRRVAPGDSVRLELTAEDLAHPSSWSWNWR